ncbi:MAG: GatB/YqeY domain-containing protein [Thermoleophilaceae bacterium]
MSVLDRIRADTVAAMKAGDRQRAGALRLISSELQKAAKEAPDGGLDETTVLRRERKRRTEAAAAYRDAGRADLAAGEEAEAEILAGYLPAELSDEELAALVGDAVAESGATSVREMGKVMPLAMARVDGSRRRAPGQRDGARAPRRVAARSLLLAAIAERSHGVVVDARPGRRYHEPPISLIEGLLRRHFDANADTVRPDLHHARAEAETIPQELGDNQSTCLVDGCLDGPSLPLRCLMSPAARCASQEKGSWTVMSR